MSRDEMIRLARVAGFAIERDDVRLIEMLSDFAALATAVEREACAKVCDATPPQPFRPSIEAAHAIRARGK